MYSYVSTDKRDKSRYFKVPELTDSAYNLYIKRSTYIHIHTHFHSLKYVIIVFTVLVNIYIYNTNKSVYLYIATIWQIVGMTS